MGGLVAGMVTVGGITRLTRSGLSMTDWKLQGSLPPMNLQEWEREFERYKKYPEWQQRKSMTLEEFKFIYFWEWGHRMMGRGIGVAFTLPLLYFLSRGMIPRSSLPRMALLFSLGGGQGLIGWWMVKSGLEKGLIEEVAPPGSNKEIRVSPYRLATHLSMAFTTYTCLLWTGLDAFNPASKAVAVASSMPVTYGMQALRLRQLAIVSGALTAATIVSGAYVAGNDAGRAYNTFPFDGTPWMNGEWVPSGILEMQPVWRNFFENTATVQFDHRVLALTTLSSVAGLYAAARRSAGGLVWAALPTQARALFHATAIMAVGQVGLGIATLLLYVPIPLAAVHQFGSLTLLTFLTALTHSLNFSKYSRAMGSAAVIAQKIVK
jgi:cytochrome c oxidase assembly protein subunit 15